MAASTPRKGPKAPDPARTAEEPETSNPSPLDHLPVGRWQPTSLEDSHDGEILALRLPTEDPALAMPDVWIWRRGPADQLTVTENVAAIKIYGLGPAFVTRGGLGDPIWELWKLTPAAPGSTRTAETLPLPSPSPTEVLGPPRTLPGDHPANPDQLAERRTRTGARRHDRPKPKGPATGPYRAPKYVRRGPQAFYDQDEDDPRRP